MFSVNFVVFFALYALFPDTKANFNCSVCYGSDASDCKLEVGIVTILDDNTRNMFDLLIRFIHETEMLPKNWNMNIKFFPSDNNETKLRDPTGWGLVGLIGDEILESNITAVIGPDRSSSVIQIHQLVVLKNLVQIAPLASDTILGDELRFPNLVRMVPPDDQQIQAIVGMLEYQQYTCCSVIFTNGDYGNDAFRAFWIQAHEKGIKIEIIHRLDNLVELDVSSVLNRVKLHRPHAVVVFTYKVPGSMILQTAFEANMTVSRGWLWIVSDGVASAELSPLNSTADQMHFNGIIGARPATFNSDLYTAFLPILVNASIPEQLFDYRLRKYADSLLALAKAFPKFCENKKEEDSNGLRDSLLNVSFSGFSNDVKFDEDKNVFLSPIDLLTSMNSSWIQIGTWNNGKLNINEDAATALKTSSDILFHLKVVTIIERPFVYFANDKNSDDADQLQGYCIDLLKELSKKCGFTYNLHLVGDGRYGGRNASSSTWGGMIGEVQRNHADLAIGSITATQERATAIDFLPSFMDVRLKFIFNKKSVIVKGRKYSPFAFLFPFSISLYVAIIVSVILLASFLCIFSKLSPYGIRGSFFLSEKADQLNNSKSFDLSQRTKKQLLEEKKDADRGMGLNNALYFVWAALFWQTPERVPRSISARVVTVTWYLAAVVFVASYTANMVAVVSRHDHTSHTIKSLSDLLLQTDLKYGTVLNSAVETQMRLSEVKLAQKLHGLLWQNAGEHFVSNATVGLEKVKKGDFVFLWDSVSLDYAAVQSDCKFETVDVGFGSVEYAFAMQKNSSFFNSLSSHLIRLKERGFMNQLYGNYFSTLSSCKLQKPKSNSKPRQLTFQDLAGIFYLVAMSMAVGFCLLLGEWLMVALNDVDKRDLRAPQSVSEAIRRRLNRLVEDFQKNCFPFESISEKWSRLTLPNQNLAQKAIEERINESSSTRLHHNSPKFSHSDEVVETITRKR